MEVISTKRGGKKLCLDGFMYTVKSDAKSKNERCGDASDKQQIPALLFYKPQKSLKMLLC